MAPQTPPATRRAAPTKSETAVVITLETNSCYRESKFPEGHKERACHIGLAALDASICTHCTWYGQVIKKPVAKLTGEHRIALLDFLKKIRDEGVPGIAPEEAPAPIPPRAGFFLRLLARIF